MRRIVLAFATIVALWSAVSVAYAQSSVPWTPPEALDLTRHLDNDQIVFCINKNSVLSEFDRAVANAIADSLLLKATFFDVEMPTRRPLTDFRILLDEHQLFITLTNRCDAFMGFRNSPGLVPRWMTVSQPYLTSRVLFYSTNESYHSLADIPAGEMIGTRMGAPGDNALFTYLRALPEASRPSRVPYPDNTVLIERLKDGSVSTIFVWELAPFFATDGHPEALGLKASFAAPFSVVPLEFSVGMLKQNTYVRELIDSAIAALHQDGTITRIAADMGFPPDASL